MNNICLEKIKAKITDENIHINEPMSRHTTFRCGGPASAFIEVSSKDELIDVLNILRKEKENFYILGNGSNVLIDDSGYDGVIVSTRKLNDIEITGNIAKVMAGAMNSSVAGRLKENGLSGYEGLAGIPGTIGGGVYMNAGAYGYEMKDVVESVTVIDTDGSIKTISNADMKFSYRYSIAKEKKFTILEITLKLSNADKKDIEEKMADFANRRREKQPLEYPSAGSTFKRPEGYFAGKLIEDAGLKGFAIGGAMVSKKHSGFVINYDNATAKDVKEVIKHVQDKVYKEFGVKLETEVIML